MEAVTRPRRQRRGPQRGEAQWQALVTKQAASGQSVATFCAEEAVSLWSFRRWRRRHRGPGGADRPEASGFVDLGTLGTTTTGRTFELTLDLGGGVVLRLVRG